MVSRFDYLILPFLCFLVKSDIKAFIDIVRAYLTMRAFSLNSASAKACRNIMETVIVPTIHHLNRTTEFTETDNYEMALCIFVFVEEVRNCLWIWFI